MRYKHLLAILLFTGIVLCSTACNTSVVNNSTYGVNGDTVTDKHNHEENEHNELDINTVSDNDIDTLSVNKVANNIIYNFNEISENYNGNTESLINTVENMCKTLEVPINVECTEVTSGILDEFSEEIKGFSNALRIKSIDTDILFEGYIFEISEDTDIVDFSLSLSDKANLDWSKYGDDARLTVTNNDKDLVLYVIHTSKINLN